MNFRTLKISDVLNLSDSDIDEMDSSTLQKYLNQAKRWASERKRRALDAYTTGKSQDLILGKAYEDIGTKPIYTKSGKKKWTGIRDIENWQDVDFYDVGRDDRERLKIAIKFLSTKTSTIYGQKEFMADIKSRLEIKTKATIDPIMFKEFWKIVHINLADLTSQTTYRYSNDSGKSHIPTKEFQKLVWDEMMSRGERPTEYNFKQDSDNDEYANKILNSIRAKLDINYQERMKELKKEDEMEKKDSVIKLSTKF